MLRSLWIYLLHSTQTVHVAVYLMFWSRKDSVENDIRRINYSNLFQLDLDNAYHEVYQEVSNLLIFYQS